MRSLLWLCLMARLAIATDSILGDEVESKPDDAGGSEDIRLICVEPYTACPQDTKFCCPPGTDCVDGKCPFEALENAGFAKFGKLVGRNGEVIDVAE